MVAEHVRWNVAFSTAERNATVPTVSAQHEYVENTGLSVLTKRCAGGLPKIRPTVRELVSHFSMHAHKVLCKTVETEFGRSYYEIGILA